MLTTDELVKVCLVAVAGSFVGPVAMELAHRWRTQLPRFWTRLCLFLAFWRKYPW